MTLVPAEPVGPVFARAGFHPPEYVGALFASGWEAVVRVRYDANIFTADQVAELMALAGVQHGVGVGRPGSRSGAHMGWGTFEVV